MRALLVVLALTSCRNIVADDPDAGVVGAEGEGEGEAAEGEGETGCPSEPVFGMVVVVEDNITDAPLCDATVTITEGAFSETLLPRGAVPDCDYAGAADNPGIYTIGVSHPDYTAETVPNIEVFFDDVCDHAIFRRVEVSLDP